MTLDKDSFITTVTEMRTKIEHLAHHSISMLEAVLSFALIHVVTVTFRKKWYKNKQHDTFAHQFGDAILFRCFLFSRNFDEINEINNVKCRRSTMIKKKWDESMQTTDSSRITKPMRTKKEGKKSQNKIKRRYSL